MSPCPSLALASEPPAARLTPPRGATAKRRLCSAASRCVSRFSTTASTAALSTSAIVIVPSCNSHLREAAKRGRGHGKWRLRVRGFPWYAMSLLESPPGT